MPLKSCKHLRSFVIIFFCFFPNSLSVAPAHGTALSDATAATLRDSSCGGCHGADGNSSSDAVPRINGQNVAYLRARLQSLRYPMKESPRAIQSMGAVSARMNRDIIVALADFYAAQSPPSSGVRLSKAGEILYRKGAADVPACESCHGADGAGSGSIPRHAGLHREYIFLQLQAFGIAARISDTANGHAWHITTEQAQAVAAFLGG
jgi:cytochrome c553